MPPEIEKVFIRGISRPIQIPLIRLHEGGGGSVAGPSKEKKGYGGIQFFQSQDLKQCN